MIKRTGRESRHFFSKKRFISLNVKLAFILLAAAITAIGVFVILGLIENQVGNRFFSSRKVVNELLDERYSSLETYIKKENVYGTDSALLQEWIDTMSYTEIVIYDKDQIMFTSGWVIDTNGRVRLDSQALNTNAEEDQSYNAPYVYATPKIDVKNFHADKNNRIVQFADKKYYVYINVRNDTAWYSFMNIVRSIAAVAAFFLVMLLYNKQIINRIIEASDNVRIISEGELERPFQQYSNDEIGDLSTSVEILRESLLEKTEGEKAAIEANNELITSMSHDIRTPLTSLIGYIDIIADKRYQSQEDLEKYIASCKEKAVQLKGLSDKLFNYFLVFGKEGEETRDFEIVDGSLLFQQMITEHASELQIKGYSVNVQYNVPEEIMVRADISSIMRVFDNLFSNMMKYASDEFPIEIKGDFIQNKIKLIFQNHIAEVAKKVESTKIGVKTCKKICEDHGAVFHAMEEERIYTTEILFETVPKEPPEGESGREDGGRSEESGEGGSDSEGKADRTAGSAEGRGESAGEPSDVEQPEENAESRSFDGSVA